MKKISLRKLELAAIAQLSRSQLKEVLGGNRMPMTTGSGKGCSNVGDSCTTSDGKPGTCTYRGNLLVCVSVTNNRP